MTIERDDPENVSERELRARDRRLCRWVIRTTGAELIRDGIPLPVVETIVHDAYLQYERFRTSVTNPRLLLVKRVLAGAESYRKGRGVPPPEQPQPSAPPDLLDLIHMRVGAGNLTENARKTLALLFDGTNRTYDDIASELGVTVLYVERVAGNGVKLLRKWAAQKWPEVPW